MFESNPDSSMFNLESNAFNNIRRELKSEYPILGEFERKVAISLLLDYYEGMQDEDEPKKVAAYHEDLMSKSDENLLYLIKEKGLL